VAIPWSAQEPTAAELKKHGFLKYLVGGMQVIFRKKPEILPLQRDARDYDLIFIGTPVWAGCYTPPLRTFFEAVDLADKKIVLFCTYEGGLGKTFDNMKKALPGNEFIDEMDFVNVLANQEENREKAAEWSKKIIKFSLPSS